MAEDALASDNRVLNRRMKIFSTAARRGSDNRQWRRGDSFRLEGVTMTLVLATQHETDLHDDEAAADAHSERRRGLRGGARSARLRRLRRRGDRFRVESRARASWSHLPA